VQARVCIIRAKKDHRQTGGIKKYVASIEIQTHYLKMNSCSKFTLDHLGLAAQSTVIQLNAAV